MSAALTSPAIAACCHTAAAATVTIEVVERTGSTNADLLGRLSAQAGTRLTGPTLRVALEQHAGRGRAGRSWHSNQSSLTFSLAWRLQQPLVAVAGLPLAVGVSVAEVLAARGIAVTLKWPNDILHHGCKLAGILIETVSDDTLLQQACWVVIGVGINLETVPVAQAASPASNAAALPATDRNRLMAELLDALTSMLACFGQTGLAPFVARWNALHAHAGARVNIMEANQVRHSGRALGIDGGGRLLLDTAQGQIAVLAGDVSLRMADDAAANGASAPDTRPL